jgi:hypothetical protein
MGLLNFPDKNIETPMLVERERADRIYQEFMIDYVKRINAATLNVVIGGVRIGSAKYSRLAQINLKSRIITFSRYAVENVPEASRRYLVVHELAHVKEASHNKKFWQIVSQYVPDYKRVEKELERCFRANVKNDARLIDPVKALNAFVEVPPLPARKVNSITESLETLLRKSFAAESISQKQDWHVYPCFNEEEETTGIVCGGSDDDGGESEVYENFIV